MHTHFCRLHRVFFSLFGPNYLSPMSLVCQRDLHFIHPTAGILNEERCRKLPCTMLRRHDSDGERRWWWLVERTESLAFMNSHCHVWKTINIVTQTAAPISSRYLFSVSTVGRLAEDVMAEAEYSPNGVGGGTRQNGKEN